MAQGYQNRGALWRFCEGFRMVNIDLLAEIETANLRLVGAERLLKTWI